MGITALIAGGIGAIGSIGGSLISSNASKNASNAQVSAQQAALAQQKELYGQGLQTAENTLQPFVSAGQSVLPTLQGLITPGPNQNALLEQTPGFQFASQYGTKAATNALASKGLGASAGPLATAISGFNNGLAQTTWGNLVNSLQGYASMGEGAAGTLGTAALQGGVAAGNSQASTMGQIGNAQASGILGSANALSGGLSGAANSLSTAALLSGAGGGGLYNTGSMPATGPGSPGVLQSNAYAISQGINPFG